MLVVAEPPSLNESRSDVTLVNRSFDDPPHTDSEKDIHGFFICSVSQKRLFVIIVFEPVLKKCKTSEQFDMAILKAASDRVTDILRESRQRVDAGQDPCAKRSKNLYPLVPLCMFRPRQEKQDAGELKNSSS